MEAMKQRVALLLLASSILATCLGDQCIPKCEGEGSPLYPNLKDCSKYYQCAHGTPYPMSCPGDLLFSPSSQRCEYPNEVDCSPSDSDCSSDKEDSDEVENPSTAVVPDEETETAGSCRPPCKWAGLYLPHPQDCTKFYVCGDDKVAVEFSCQSGLLYDMTLRRCDYPHLANCIAGPHRACDELLAPESGSGGEDVDPVVPQPSTEAPVEKCRPPCAWGGLYLPHPQDCTKFYICGDDKVAIEFPCQDGLLYDMVNRRCEWPHLASCIAGPNRACDELLQPNA